METLRNIEEDARTNEEDDGWSDFPDFGGVEEAETHEISPEAVSKIDEYMMSSSEDPVAMAGYVADLAGVAAGVKPTAFISILPTELNLEQDKLAELIDAAGLVSADGWEDGKFFVSKEPELAAQLKKQFEKLWSGEITEEEDRDLGRMLGYPETAVNQDFEKPEGIVGKIKSLRASKEDPTLDRHYKHSPEHQEEEFEAYERPIHEYMEKNCPEAARVLKAQKTAKGKTFRWL